MFLFNVFSDSQQGTPSRSGINHHQSPPKQGSSVLLACLPMRHFSVFLPSDGLHVSCIQVAQGIWGTHLCIIWVVNLQRNLEFSKIGGCFFVGLTCSLLFYWLLDVISSLHQLSIYLGNLLQILNLNLRPFPFDSGPSPCNCSRNDPWRSMFAKDCRFWQGTSTDLHTM